MAPEPFDDAPDTLLSGWGRTSPTRATVWTPSRTEDIAARVGSFGPRGVVARGLGRSYGDAAQNAGGTVVQTGALDRILELDVQKGRLTAEAGLSLDALLRVLVPLGWFPMVVPGTRYVSLGGAVASDIHGKFRHGSFTDYVQRLSLVTPSRGVLTVGPEEEPDVFWDTAGGMGMTGVVTEVTMQLQPIETPKMLVEELRANDVDECMDRMLSTDGDYQYSVAWIDCVARGKHLGRSVITRGNHATLADLPPKQRRSARVYAPRTMMVAPPWLPNGILNHLSIRAFNEAWFRKAPKYREGMLHGISSFFFPLDFVSGWNRIYGSNGFVQYQYAVPYGAEDIVRATLERLSNARSASFLAVLKRFEHSNASPLSFAMPGWTLALDIPAGRPNLAALLDELDELVVGAGGRVYLTKDSRVRGQLLPAMYPQLDVWRERRAALDPHDVMRSDLSRRLGLTERTNAR
jgi:decaprenylphospho-beta-D-ribofuranose 2-oxidase